MGKNEALAKLDAELFALSKKLRTSEFLQVMCEMLNVDARGQGMQKAHFVGEICEVVLIVLTEKYLKQSNKQGWCYHSVVLGDVNDRKSNFRTELDFVLVTPSFVLTTECKSYAGAVSITDKCTLSHKGRSADVFKQSALHFRTLQPYVEKAVLPSVHIARAPFFANAFIFSNATVDDKRARDAKAFRVDTTSSLFSYYDALFKKYTKAVYNCKDLCALMDVSANSTRLHKEHQRFVGY